MDFFLQLPFFWAVLALFIIVMCRANGTYWIARSIALGTEKSRWSGIIHHPNMVRAQMLVTRYGSPVVALSFLTIGIQTAVNAAAGILKMPLKRYLPAVVVGSLMWAFLYATIGFAVFEAWIAATIGQLWPLLAIVGVVIVIVIIFVLRARRRRREIEHSKAL